VDTHTYVDIGCTSPNLAVILTLVQTVGVPLVLCGTVVIMASIFRQPLSRFIDRLLVAKFWGSELSAKSQEPPQAVVKSVIEAPGTKLT
jgi:hypothetical protein